MLRNLEMVFYLVYGFCLFCPFLYLVVNYYFKKIFKKKYNIDVYKEMFTVTKGTVLKIIPENGEGEVIFKRFGQSMKRKAVNIGNTPVLPGTEVFVLKELKDRLLILPNFRY